MDVALAGCRANKAGQAIQEAFSGLGEELGRRIVRFRERKGWRRTDLARELGVGRERLAKWERGVYEPPLAVLVRLGRLLKVTLDELVTGEPPAGTGLTRAEQAKLAFRLEKMREWLR
jgi:transcriptional regulator with XRE-family HTH domain